MNTKKILAGLFITAAATFGLSSCAVVATPVGSGLIVTSSKTGEFATSNDLGTKVGTAKSLNVLGLVVSGDASIETAAKSAGIKKISHIDNEKFCVLGIWSTYKIYVYGE